jgi:hypothetical protein
VKPKLGRPFKKKKIDSDSGGDFSETIKKTSGRYGPRGPYLKKKNKESSGKSSEAEISIDKQSSPEEH